MVMAQLNARSIVSSNLKCVWVDVPPDFAMYITTRYGKEEIHTKTYSRTSLVVCVLDGATLARRGETEC